MFAAGWLAIMEAFFTASVPGGLEMIGKWDDDLATVVVAIGTVAVVGGPRAAVALVAAPCRRLTSRRCRRPARPHRRLPPGSRGSIAATTITMPPTPSSTSPTE